MKQITPYTDIQETVLKCIEEFTEYLKSQNNLNYGFQQTSFFNFTQDLKTKYDIHEKYLTLREYLKKHSHGAYHRFYFNIEDVKVSNITGIDEFERYYNNSLLDKYYVLKDEDKSSGSNCENYQCDHYLTIVKKDD